MAIDTITSNERYVRLRIFEGDLKIDDAAAELLRIERVQNDALRRQMDAIRAELRAEIRLLRNEGIARRV